MSCISSYGISTKRERSKEKSEQVRREKVGDIEGVAEEVRSLEVALCSSQRARILDKVALIVGSTELVVVLGTVEVGRAGEGVVKGEGRGDGAVVLVREVFFVGKGVNGSRLGRRRRGRSDSHRRRGCV
jgi:hypothetical protein